MSTLTLESSTLQSSRVLQALNRSPIPVLRDLSVEETESVVKIDGSVSSYYLKQLAQETIMPFLDGRPLHNRVTVDRVRHEPNF